MISNYILVPLVTAAGIYLIVRWVRPKPYPSIPCHPVTSFLGDIPAMASDTMKYGSVFEPGAFFPRSIQELGPVFQFFAGPLSKSIVIADLQEIEDILLRTRVKALELSDMQIVALQGMLPYGSVALKTNEMWNRHRRVTTPFMSSKHLNEMTPAIAANARALVVYWKSKIDVVKQHNAVCFSCQNDFEMGTLDIIGEVIVGRSLGMIAHAQSQTPTVKVDQHGGAVFEVSPTPLFASLRYLFSFFADNTVLPPWAVRGIQAVKAWAPGFRRARRVVDEYISTCLEESRKNVRELREIGQEVEAAKCMIEMVTSKEGLPGEDSLPDHELKDEIITFLLVKFLTDHPEVQRTLHAELCSAFEDLSEDRLLTYADVTSPDKTPYLEAVVAEVLRCARAAEGSRRQGYEIPVGADIIFISPTAASMTTKSAEPSIRAYDNVRSETSLKYGLQGKRMWEDDTQEFKPERWIVVDEKTGKRVFDQKAGGSVPFGLGLRACPGKAIAVLELKIFLATINLSLFLGSVPKELSGYAAVIQLDEAIARSLEDLAPIVGPSNAASSSSPMSYGAQSEPAYLRRHELQTRVSALSAEIASIEEDIARLNAVRDGCLKERSVAEQELNSIRFASAAQHNLGATTAGPSTSNPASREKIDYGGEFEWSAGMKAKMRAIFGIWEFRLCQEAVCNANMDRRDIVCVMPTGGGKSLTYQLPALMTPGCTLVISPLISLITDQILHLQDAGIEAVMLTGTTSKDESRSIFARLTGEGGRGAHIRAADGASYKEIKLCYVTPEKIVKNKTLNSALSKMAAAGRFARIVIDEAHCVSQMGHDYRPDYQKLTILRQLFPDVPIMALSATCPPQVLQDLLRTLNMRQVVDGRQANLHDTCYFSAPLYRKNLHYKVVSKPSAKSDTIKAIADYILQHHKDDTGIIYCLSRKEAQEVADDLANITNGQIKTGVYHAEVGDSAKERLHIQWREGKVKVVCATIAFGLGIDKGDVRFVIHHSMSKSLEGFYQESGRAGRDGKDADCILYFRAQDASRLAALTAGEKEAKSKLHAILRFALDKVKCRKIAFAEYFSAATSLSLSSWNGNGSTFVDRCGHCDNCTRPPESNVQQDVTLEAWKLCKVLDEVDGSRGRLTITTLAALARGNGGGTFDVQEGGKGKRRKSKAEATIDLHALCGGKITTLSRDDTENLIVQLLVAGYMKETYNSTAYNITAYVAPGGQSIRLTRLSLDKVQSGAGERVHMLIPPKPTKAKAPKSSGKGSNEATENKNSGPVRRNGSLADFVAKKNTERGTDNRRNNAGKGKGKAKESDEDVVAETDDDQDDYGNDPDDMPLPDSLQHIVSDPDFEDDDPDETRHPSKEPPRGRARAYRTSSSVHTIVESEEEDDGWKFNLSAQPKTAAKWRVVEDSDGDEVEDSEPVQPKRKRPRNEEPEVITISDTD
ncbi:hypothetical protein FRC04_010344 [Tulasnella sp. 424]|nr:hypothetical protein FRC04_010344 [Tulasnella sp. 424]KAG8978717.1 hypothetical protein FRC05_009990 [Tulasnella sp. 425]